MCACLSHTPFVCLTGFLSVNVSPSDLQRVQGQVSAHTNLRVGGDRSGALHRKIASDSPWTRDTATRDQDGGIARDDGLRIEEDRASNVLELKLVCHPHRSTNKLKLSILVIEEGGGDVNHRSLQRQLQL